MSKIRIEYTDEFGTTSACEVQDSDNLLIDREFMIDWFQNTALPGIGFKPVEFVVCRLSTGERKADV